MRHWSPDFLYLNSNSLTGTIPSEISLLTELRKFLSITNLLEWHCVCDVLILLQLGPASTDGLYLEDNMMTGTIPSKMSFLDDLGTFLSTFSDHSLSHNVGILNLSCTETLYLYGNTWTGEFTCPDFIDECLVSCNGYLHGDCRSLLS